jgi:hypothetical protein
MNKRYKWSRYTNYLVTQTAGTIQYANYLIMSEVRIRREGATTQNLLVSPKHSYGIRFDSNDVKLFLQ